MHFPSIPWKSMIESCCEESPWSKSVFESSTRSIPPLSFPFLKCFRDWERYSLREISEKSPPKSKIFCTVGLLLLIWKGGRGRLSIDKPVVRTRLANRLLLWSHLSFTCWRNRMVKGKIRISMNLRFRAEKAFLSSGLRFWRNRRTRFESDDSFVSASQEENINISRKWKVWCEKHPLLFFPFQFLLFVLSFSDSLCRSGKFLQLRCLSALFKG